MQSRMLVLSVSVATTLLLAGTLAIAFPPPGGGSGTGGGTIYFRYATVLNTMNSDGGNKTPLPAGVTGEPSYACMGENSARWFLHVANDELYAVRGDAGIDVQLTDSLDTITALEAQGSLAWAKDNPATSPLNEADTFLSFLGTDGGGLETVYRADVAFDAAGVPSLASAPIAIVTDPNILGFDWAPDGVRLVYSRQEPGTCGTTACGVIHVFQAGVGDYTLTNGYVPVWSPNGAKIAFRTWGFIGNIGAINPNGTGLLTIATGHAGQYITLNTPKWSPGSTHLIYHRAGGFGSSVSEVYRTSATGGNPTNLSKELDTTFLNAAFPVAWR